MDDSILLQTLGQVSSTEAGEVFFGRTFVVVFCR